MIIRHDLKLVFLHVPKCAGKEIRDVLLTGASEGAAESLFNFCYCKRLRRYVDLAHLPMDDLVHQPQFQWLDRYYVIAAIRHPLARLRSAANEFHRQRSKAEEAVVNRVGLPEAWCRRYIAELPWRHAGRDPRYIHSLPITTFTHLGEQPMVDHLLHCQSLRDDLLILSEQLDWPVVLQQAIRERLRNSAEPELPLCDDYQEWMMAQRLYQHDYSTFGFEVGSPPKMQRLQRIKRRVGLRQGGWADAALAELEPSSSESHSRDLTAWTSELRWHWGPTAQQTHPSHAWPAVRARS